MIRVATGQTRVQAKVIRGRSDDDDVIDVEARTKDEGKSRRSLDRDERD
jgi:hypothetical protein